MGLLGCVYIMSIDTEGFPLNNDRIVVPHNAAIRQLFKIEFPVSYEINVRAVDEG